MSAFTNGHTESHTHAQMCFLLVQMRPCQRDQESMTEQKVGEKERRMIERRYLLGKRPEGGGEWRERTDRQFDILIQLVQDPEVPIEQKIQGVSGLR